MKSKKLVKLFSLLMAFAIVLTAFTGCAKKVTNEPSTDGTQVKATATPVPATPVPTPIEEKPLKFSMSVSNGLNEYIMKSPDINKDKWLLEINKRFNCDITLVLIEHGRYNEQMQMMFASGEIPDLIKGYESYLRPDMAGSVENGVFMALDELLADNKAELTNLLGQVPENAWNEMKYDDKIYGIPSTFLSQPNRRATYIRKDLLDQTGLGIPRTLDEYLEVLKAFKELGVVYPFAGREFWLFSSPFFGAFGVEYTVWSPDKDGNLTPDMIKPEMKQALEFYAMLYEEGLMDPESLTTSGGDWLNHVYSGKVGIFEHQPGQLDSFKTNLRKHVVDGDLILAPAPQGPDGRSGYRNFPQVGQALYINKNFKEPLRLLKVIDSMGTPEAQEFFTFGILGETYEKVNGKIEYTMPTEPIDQQEASFREKTLNLLRDDSTNPLLSEFKPTAQEEEEYRKNVAPNEGLVWYQPVKIPSFDKYPDLVPGEKNVNLFLEYAAKIFYGQLPASAHDDFVKEYLKRGGTELVKEATEAYKAGKTFKR